MWAFAPRRVGNLKFAAHWRLWLAILATACGYCGLDGRAASNPVQVSTYHGDTLRTGWNEHETVLTPASVLKGGFKQQSVVDLDAQVDAQPLFVGSQAINGKGTHNVVYVATERDTVYAI